MFLQPTCSECDQVTSFDPWSSLLHLAICCGTNLRLGRLVPIVYGIFELAGAHTQETEIIDILWLPLKHQLSR